jgi:hypothetical protein
MKLLCIIIYCSDKIRAKEFYAMSGNIELIKEEWKAILQLLAEKCSSMCGLSHIGKFDLNISEDGNSAEFWLAGQKDNYRSEILVNPMNGGISLTVYTPEEVETIYDYWDVTEIQKQSRYENCHIYPKIRLRWNDSGMLTCIMIDVSFCQLISYSYNSKKGIYEVDTQRTREQDLRFFNLPENIGTNEMIIGKHIPYNVNFPRKIKRIINDSRIKELRRELEVEK